MPILGIVLVVAATVSIRTVLFYRTHVETDDAQLSGDISPILPRVSGFVTEAPVAENLVVHAGDPLVALDDRDLKAKALQADAAVKNAEAELAEARANEIALLSTRDRTASDAHRDEALSREGAISTQQLDAARAAASAAEGQYQAGTGKIAATTASVAQKRADLEFAKLQLGYTRIVAPVGGVITRKNVEIGQYVQAGQQLMAIVQSPDIWVVANFKETQLRRMRPGQRATFKVDAYPGHEFKGRVQSISAATGATFAVLPPDNATGNFTKIVQRIPVKITLDEPADPARPLRIGMSVTAVVDLDSR